MNKRRNGKIARLPEELRTQVNELLEDGWEYTRVIEWLENQGHPGFTVNNFSRWYHGGFQDWLHYTQRLDELELRLKYATQLAESAGTCLAEAPERRQVPAGSANPATASPNRQFLAAALNLTSIQFFDVLNRFDPNSFGSSLAAKPEKYIQFVNSLARLARETVAFDKFQTEQAPNAPAKKNAPNALTVVALPLPAAPAAPKSYEGGSIPCEYRPISPVTAYNPAPPLARTASFTLERHCHNRTSTLG